jgi:hypothetical protein
MCQKSLCPYRETPINGQIFVLPAYKKITLQTFGISETLFFYVPLRSHNLHFLFHRFFIVFGHLDHVWIMINATVYFKDHNQ